ncbi:MAG: MFS transporter, partial [Alphaproteobacteria bacterium]|nr:MFS transporter [Alphaproteobacteria bacterium]
IGSLPAIVLSALVIGIGYGPLTPAGSHVLAQVTPPERRSLVFSIKQTGVPAGPFVAGLAVPQIIILSGWQGALEAMAGVCALSAALLIPFRRQIDGMAPVPAAGSFSLRRAVLDPLQRVLRHRMLRALMLVSFGLAGIQVVLSTFFVTYLTQSAGFTLAWAGLALSLSQAAGVVGRIAWGALADRVGARPVLYALAAGTCAAALLTAGMHAGWPLAAVLVVGTAFGATASGWNGVFLAEVARLAPKGEVAPVTSGVLTATYAGVITMPSLVSLVVGATGSWASAFGLAVAAVAVPVLMLAATARAEARSQGEGG